MTYRKKEIIAFQTRENSSRKKPSFFIFPKCSTMPCMSLATETPCGMTSGIPFSSSVCISSENFPMREQARHRNTFLATFTFSGSRGAPHFGQFT